MTLRIQFAVGVAVAAIVLPFIIVQAQSEGETQPAAPEQPAVVEQPAAEVVTPQEESAPVAEPEQETAGAQDDAPEGEVLGESGTGEEGAIGTAATESTSTPAAAEGSVLGGATTKEAASSSEQTVPEGALTTAPEPQGAVLGESDTAAEASTATEAATTTGTEPLHMVAASTTEATSTPPVEEPKPVEEPFVLQPAVDLSINGNTVSAAITLQNLTCKVCDKVLPELEVLTYYTEWYPNDGPVKEYSQASVQSGKQARSVADLPNGASRGLTWSAEVPSGHYYFVVEVDPENAHGARYLFRSEMKI